MKTTSKALGTLALAVIGASVAHADSQAVGNGFAAALYYESAPGFYFTSASGQYTSIYQTGGGPGTNWWVGDFAGGLADTSGGVIQGYNGGVNWPQYSQGYGTSFSGTAGGGSFAFGTATSENFVTIANLTNNWQQLYIVADAFGYSSSYAATALDSAYGVGFGAFWDSNESIYLSGEAEAASLGLGGGGMSFYSASYDPYSGYNSSTTYYGNSFPGYVSGYTSDYQWFQLWFAPGESDTFYTYASSVTSASATTPGPVAFAPFALGLLGTLRRRRPVR